MTVLSSSAGLPGARTLMGGNVDYAGGLVFEATIRSHLGRGTVTARPVSRLLEPGGGGAKLAGTAEFELDDLVDEEAVRLLVEVPLNRRVSSSAAARAYGLDLPGIELGEACQWVENVVAESACGIMDQATAVMGDEGCLSAYVPALPVSSEICSTARR